MSKLCTGLYVKSEFLPHREHVIVSTTKINHLIHSREVIGVDCEHRVSGHKRTVLVSYKSVHVVIAQLQIVYWDFDVLRIHGS